MAFSGTDSPDTAILVSPGGSLTATPFSAMGWVRPRVDNSGTVIGVWSSAATAERAWRVVFTSATLRLRVNVSFDGAGTNVTFSTTVFTLNVWAHVGIDFDGSTLRLFINGVVDASASFSGTVFASSHTLGIGAYDDVAPATASELDGDIEDVRYYDRILDVKEWVTIHRVRGLDGIAHGLVSRWPINERPNGTTILAADPKDIGPAQLTVNQVVGAPVYITGELRDRRAA